MSSLLSPSEVGRLLNLHPNSVRRLAAEGRLRSQRVGWSRVFELDDVKRFSEERRRKRRTVVEALAPKRQQAEGDGAAH